MDILRKTNNERIIGIEKRENDDIPLYINAVREKRETYFDRITILIEPIITTQTKER